jgi:hypothetical protein
VVQEDRLMEQNEVDVKDQTGESVYTLTPSFQVEREWAGWSMEPDG